MTSAPGLELRGIAKSFGSVEALSHVDLTAWPGEVHAIIGDNGAGKSTTIKIITGIHQGDAGEILIEGDPVSLDHSASESKNKGVAVVYQDLALVECLDIASNMALGNLPRKWRLVLDRKRMDHDAAAVLNSLNVRVGDVRTPVGLLSGGQRQVVAIARAVRADHPIILLDEPTAALGVRETVLVGDIIDGLRTAGKTVICVSHDLDFVLRHADRVTVLRLGRSVGTRRVDEVTRENLVAMITGLSAEQPPEGRTA